MPKQPQRFTRIARTLRPESLLRDRFDPHKVDVSLSLTPALSRWERENFLPSLVGEGTAPDTLNWQ